MIRNENREAENSDSPTLSGYLDNGSKPDLRAYLNATLRIKGPASWTLALKPKTENAGFAESLGSVEWKALLVELCSANAIGLFVAHEAWDEAQDLERSLHKLLGPRPPRFAYPRTQPGTQNLEFALCDLKDTVQNGKWRSAPAQAPTIEPDVLFIPGLSMDTLGNRLGRGQGFYDRYLLMHPRARRIGTIHSRFVVEEFSNNWIEEHDQSLEVLWTERGIYRTPKFRLKLNKE